MDTETSGFDEDFNKLDPFDDKDIQKLCTDAKELRKHGKPARRRKESKEKLDARLKKATQTRINTMKHNKENVEKVARLKLLRDEIISKRLYYESPITDAGRKKLELFIKQEDKLNKLIDDIEKQSLSILNSVKYTSYKDKLTSQNIALCKAIVIDKCTPKEAWKVANYKVQWSMWNFELVWNRPIVQAYVKELESNTDVYKSVAKENLIKELQTRLATATNNDAVNIVKTLSKLLGYDAPEQKETNFNIKWEGLDGSRMIDGKTQESLPEVIDAEFVELDDEDKDILEGLE